MFIYRFHILVSHRCTKVQFPNKKTISFHERLHAIIVNGCSVAKANNGWELIDIFLQCKILHILVEAVGQKEVTPATSLRGHWSAALSCTAVICASSTASESRNLLSLKKQSVAKCSLLLLPPFDILMYRESNI